MALSKSDGTIKPSGLQPNNCFSVPPSEVDEIVPQTTDVDFGKILENEAYVSKTKTNEMSGNTVNSKDSATLAAITAFSSGSPITVTFFHNLHKGNTGRSFQTDWAPSQNSVHFSFLKIHNFQFKLSSSFDFSYDSGTVTSTLTGAGVVYPYFTPNQGDLFIYEVEAGIWGLYKISSAPERLSIRSLTAHTIKFVLVSYLTSADIALLEESVDREAYFDLQRYLADEGALITLGEAHILNDIRAAIHKLEHHFVAEFFEKDIFRTFIENHCLYDPYIVEFIMRIIPSAILPCYPVQLVSDPNNWNRSFWYRLLNPKLIPSKLVMNKCLKVVKTVHYRTVGINALANKCYIMIHPKGEHPYPPFNVPVTYDETINSIQMQITLYLNELKVRPNILLGLVDNTLSSCRKARFYFTPILIFLLSRAQKALEGDGSIKIEKDDRTPCSLDCDKCIYKCAPPDEPEPKSTCHDIHKCKCKCSTDTYDIHCHSERIKCRCTCADDLIPDNGGSIENDDIDTVNSILADMHDQMVTATSIKINNVKH